MKVRVLRWGKGGEIEGEGEGGRADKREQSVEARFWEFPLRQSRRYRRKI